MLLIARITIERQSDNYVARSDAA